jgi:hypothetical protein
MRRLGVYATIVQSADYSDATAETVDRRVPELLPIRGERFGLRFTPPGGTRWDGAGLLLVTKHPYARPAPVPAAPETRWTRTCSASPPCSTRRSSSRRFQRRCDCGRRWPTDVLSHL